MHPPLGLIVVAALVALAIALWIADRVLLRMERKGWIYYRSFEPGLSARSIMGTLQEIVQPEVRHVNEEREQRKAEIDAQSPSDR